MVDDGFERGKGRGRVVGVGGWRCWPGVQLDIGQTDSIPTDTDTDTATATATANDTIDPIEPLNGQFDGRLIRHNDGNGAFSSQLPMP